MHQFSTCQYVLLEYLSRRKSNTDLFFYKLHKCETQFSVVRISFFIGWTALHEASVQGCYRIANELLKAGADVNARGSKQITPLQDAVKEGHYEVYSDFNVNCGLGIEIIVVNPESYVVLQHVGLSFQIMC